jgi:hypothetical protein
VEVFANAGLIKTIIPVLAGKTALTSPFRSCLTGSRPKPAGPPRQLPPGAQAFDARRDKESLRLQWTGPKLAVTRKRHLARRNRIRTTDAINMSLTIQKRNAHPGDISRAETRTPKHADKRPTPFHYRLYRGKDRIARQNPHESGRHQFIRCKNETDITPPPQIASGRPMPVCIALIISLIRRLGIQSNHHSPLNIHHLTPLTTTIPSDVNNPK